MALKTQLPNIFKESALWTAMGVFGLLLGLLLLVFDGPATRRCDNEPLLDCRFDVVCFDSSIMPATGTPEPGGLFWDETLNIIKIAAKNSNIVGADINELAPIKGFNSYNFLVAKLAYKILSYKFLF